MPDSPSRLLAVAKAFRQALLREERTAAVEMIQAYRWSYARIQVTLEKLLARYAQAILAQGKTEGILAAMRRADMLQEQVVRELRQFGDTAEIIVTDIQRRAAQLGAQHAEMLTKAAMGPAPAGANILSGFNKVPTEAMRDLVGFTVKGSPLRELFDVLGADVSEAARRTLLSGFTLGYNPRKIGREMAKEAGMGLDRALRISRTETLRAYRESTRRSYAANPNLIKGWIWHSAADLRTCPACWAMHGTHHTADETLDDHPNGRCAMLAETKTWAELGFPGVPESGVQIEPGADKFARLDSATQREILGPAAYEAYKAGAVKLEDFVGRKYSRDWGSMRYANSLVGMVGLEESLRYREMAAAAER